MTLGQSLLFFLVSLGASVVGAICGIGGGVIIKPTLDLFGWASVSAISFDLFTVSGYSSQKCLSGRCLLQNSAPLCSTDHSPAS